MSFDMDVTNARNGVNTNLYVISPENGVDNSGYCDIQPNGSPQVRGGLRLVSKEEK